MTCETGGTVIYRRRNAIGRTALTEGQAVNEGKHGDPSNRREGDFIAMSGLGILWQRAATIVMWQHNELRSVISGSEVGADIRASSV